jgi:hypothetical protein
MVSSIAESCSHECHTNFSIFMMLSLACVITDCWSSICRDVR